MAIRESRKIGSVALAVCLLFLTGARAEYGRALDQTINEVAREAATKLKQTGFEDIKNIAVLPLWGDCDPDTKNYIVNTIQSEIIGGPYRVMERNTQAWDTLLGEIEWGSLREDIMNADTVQRFGRIEGCDAIVYGTVRECAEYPMSGRAVTDGRRGNGRGEMEQRGDQERADRRRDCSAPARHGPGHHSGHQ
jgi:hypothetical protein